MVFPSVFPVGSLFVHFKNSPCDCNFLFFFFEKFTHTQKQETNYNRFVDEALEKNLNDRKSGGEVANMKPKEVFSLELKQSKKLTAISTKAANKKVCLYLDFKNQMNGFVLAPRGPCHVRVTSKKE